MFYGWYIVIASSLITGFNSFLFIYGFTSFVNPIIDSFGWSYTQISLGISVRNITSGILNPFLGTLVDRFPARRLLLFGGLAIGSGLMVLSRMTNLAMFYGGFVIMGLGGSLAITLVPQTTLARWFNKNLGKATAIMGFSVALAGVAVPLLVMAIDTFGWQNVLLVAAVLAWVLIFSLSLIFRNRPEDYGFAPDGVILNEALDSIERTRSIGLTVKEAIRTRTFWLIAFGYSVQAGASVAILTHIMPHFMDIGMERSYAGLIVMSLALVGLAARIPIGWLMDVTSRKNVIALSIGLSAISFVLLWFIEVDSPFFFILLFAIPFGIGNGSLWVRAALLREYFGVKHFGAITGMMFIFPLIGTSLLPPAVGLVFDNLGTYSPAFLSLGGLTMIAAVATMAIPRVSISAAKGMISEPGAS